MREALRRDRKSSAAGAKSALVPSAAEGLWRGMDCGAGGRVQGKGYEGGGRPRARCASGCERPGEKRTHVARCASRRAHRAPPSRRVALLGALVTVLVGCSRGEVVQELSRKPLEGKDHPPKQATATVEAQMESHAKRTREIYVAAVAADLQVLRRAARQLAAEEWTPALRAEWRAPYAEMRKLAGAVAESTTGPQALERFGQLGQSCANCHQATQVPEPVEAPPRPGAEQPMRLHQWAIERLWTGLTTPSDEDWKLGARAMREAELVRSDSEDIEVLARRVHSLAERAEAAEAAQRPERISEVLRTCAECHEYLEVKPPLSATFP